MLITTPSLFVPPRERRSETEVVKMGTVGVIIVALVLTFIEQLKKKKKKTCTPYHLTGYLQFLYKVGKREERVSPFTDEDI